MNNLKTTEEKEAYFYENILPIIGNIDHRHAWATTPHFDLAMTMLRLVNAVLYSDKEVAKWGVEGVGELERLVFVEFQNRTAYELSVCSPTPPTEKGESGGIGNDDDHDDGKF